MQLIPKILNDTIEIIVDKIDGDKHLKKTKLKDWKNNEDIQKEIHNICKYMAETYLYPEKYNIIVDEQELQKLLDELKTDTRFLFYFEKVFNVPQNLLLDKTCFSFASTIYDMFWHIYETNRKIIKNIRFNRK